jgi:DNA-binding MarR family transcriptional regulator
MNERLLLQDFLPYRFANLAERISQALSRIYVDRFGINVAEWRIIATLGEFGEMQAKQVTRHTNMDKVRVSRAVASLSAKGLLERHPCPGDSRAALLKLSPSGGQLYRELVPQALEWERDLASVLSDDERCALFAMLDRLESRLEEGS